LFIELGAVESQQVIFDKAAKEKSEAMLRETRLHNERIKAFSEQFSRLNELSASSTAFEAKCAEFDARTAELDIRAAELDKKLAELAVKEQEIAKRAELLDAQEQQITDSLCRKIGLKARALFK
jgi:uncharacterized protein (DUF3084 family)